MQPKIDAKASSKPCKKSIQYHATLGIDNGCNRKQYMAKNTVIATKLNKKF